MITFVAMERGHAQVCVFKFHVPASFEGLISSRSESFPVCIAKGISGERCIDGCSACRQASLICDGHIPCSNCVATNQGCVVLMDVSAHDPTEPIASIGKSTPSLRTGIAERTKTACLACRRSIGIHFSRYVIVGTHIRTQRQ